MAGHILIPILPGKTFGSAFKAVMTDQGGPPADVFFMSPVIAVKPHTVQILKFLVIGKTEEEFIPETLHIRSGKGIGAVPACRGVTAQNDQRIFRSAGHQCGGTAHTFIEIIFQIGIGRLFIGLGPGVALKEVFAGSPCVIGGGGKIIGIQTVHHEFHPGRPGIDGPGTLDTVTQSLCIDPFIRNRVDKDLVKGDPVHEFPGDPEPFCHFDRIFIVIEFMQMQSQGEPFFPVGNVSFPDFIPCAVSVIDGGNGGEEIFF